jgi:hypothetical protein
MDKRKAQESRIISKKAMAFQGWKAALVTLPYGVRFKEACRNY